MNFGKISLLGLTHCSLQLGPRCFEFAFLAMHASRFNNYNTYLNIVRYGCPLFILACMRSYKTLLFLEDLFFCKEKERFVFLEDMFCWLNFMLNCEAGSADIRIIQAY